MIFILYLIHNHFNHQITAVFNIHLLSKSRQTEDHPGFMQHIPPRVRFLRVEKRDFSNMWVRSIRLTKTMNRERTRCVPWPPGRIAFSGRISHKHSCSSLSASNCIAQINLSERFQLSDCFWYEIIWDHWRWNAISKYQEIPGEIGALFQFWWNRNCMCACEQDLAQRHSLEANKIVMFCCEDAETPRMWVNPSVREAFAPAMRTLKQWSSREHSRTLRLSAHMLEGRLEIRRRSETWIRRCKRAAFGGKVI
jgi:hypothetical protein